MARPRTTYHRRAVSESEQRELVTFDPEHHQRKQQRGFEHELSTRLDDPIQRFEILKSTPLGLVFPQNVHFSVKDVDAGIAYTGHSFDLPSDNPLFVTNELKWWKQGYILPPSFEIFSGGTRGLGSWKRTDELQTTQSTGVTGLPRSPTHDNHGRIETDKQKPYPLAKIKYNGWEGFTHLSVSLTLYNITPDMHYSHEYSHSLDEDGSHSGPNIRSKYSIVRIGWKREYILIPSGHRWRSPSLSEKKSLLSKSALDDTLPVVHGNLILEDSEANVVAVYKQRRDYEVLGNLTVSSKHVNTLKPDGRNDQPDKITLEAVLASCLALVIYERVGWQNMWGN